MIPDPVLRTNRLYNNNDWQQETQAFPPVFNDHDNMDTR
jgi:hypothetical protein